jgi:hypothetical protein
MWDDRDEVTAFDAPPDRVDNTVVHYPLTLPETGAPLAEMRDRLAAAGWRVDPISIQDDGAIHLNATADMLHLSTTYGPTVEIYLRKNATPAILASVAAGALIGLLVGWTTAVSAVHRYRRHRRDSRVAIAMAATPLLGIGPVMIVLTGVFLLFDAANAGLSAEDIQIPLTFTAGPWPVTTIIIAAGVIARALAAGTTTPAGHRPAATATRQEPA